MWPLVRVPQGRSQHWASPAQPSHATGAPVLFADFIAVSPYDVNSRLGATFKLSFNAFPGECGRQARGQPGWQRWMAVAGRGHANQRWSSAAVAAPSSQPSHIPFSFREYCHRLHPLPPFHSSRPAHPRAAAAVNRARLLGQPVACAGWRSWAALPQ